MGMVLPIYCLGHFAVDFVCAWLIFGHFAGQPGWITAALCYNFCAFALQMPVGILSDRLGRCRVFSGIGAALVCAAALPLGMWWTVLCAGLGNAFYHVGGGRETLLASSKYGPLGAFVAPGALGIFLGSLLRTNSTAGILGILLLALCGAALMILSRREIPSPQEMEIPRPKAAGLASLLFLIVLLRSLVGMCSASPWKTGIWIIIGAVLGAAGKALGGIAADRWGGRIAGGVSLLLAAALFLFPEAPLCGVLAGMLFNMSMPITLRDCADALPGGEGFAFGALTFALFLGFIPAQYSVMLTYWQTALLALLSGIGLMLAAKERVRV